MTCTLIHKYELLYKLEYTPIHPRYELDTEFDSIDGKLTFSISTDDTHDVAVRLIFKFDIDADNMLHIYTTGLNESLLNEFLTYLAICGIYYKLQ
ncbi:hypothetical protein D6D94_08210 [Moraxella catarrhalis]|uniref:Uncharacterized protein n=1 Tax=Moraxella catarrhalis TaxID=480 RepID=A0A3A9MTK6_MORCA|nr:hypothetical protein [Moraxella catarrhalis]AZQ92524.1 hypothetical protein EJK53_0882 [Moraxella catarrhalis]MCG6834658.1 hypothetical protein [Moraxella catarrhalis]MPW67405.1 hypothetical protein [Moraxella catarrhalis]MPX07969.1 hypothetical protein [Moraxella catarrhalis]MPX55830.1 hypothetical protein [Moraxella catarrhalis]